MSGSRAEARAAGLTPHVVGLPLEALPFQGRHAGVASRCVAAAIDALVVSAALLAVYLGWAGWRFLRHPRDFHFPAVSWTALIVAAGVVVVGYLAVAWSWTGRTYGDRLLGLRVVDRHDERLSFGVALVRALLCALLPLGLLWAGISSSRRSLQDEVLRTYVLYDWQRGGFIPSG